MSEHPIRLVVTDDLRRSRLTIFLRLLLAVPLFVWLVLWTIAAVVAAAAGWLAALALGRLPAGLHGFLAAYTRFVTHFYAYLSIAASPYPGFTGERGYPVDLDIPDPRPQARWRILLRLLLALPALLLAAVLGSGVGGGGGGQRADSAGEVFFAGAGGLAALCGVLGWFAALATGRMPLGLRNLAAYGLGYSGQALAYLFLLTDRYPDSDPERLGPAWELPPHAIRLELADDGRRSRLTVFFRFLLAVPHVAWLLLWTAAAFPAALANGLVTLLRGRSAGALHRFLAAYVRYHAHLTAFLFLVSNPFPGFVGKPGYPVDVAVEPPERQHRLVTLFRLFLSIPALLVAGGLSVALFVAGFLGWFSSLLTGRMPTGLRNLGAYAIRYLAQTNAYWLIVTDHYPHASPALRPPAPRLDPRPDLRPVTA